MYKSILLQNLHTTGKLVHFVIKKTPHKSVYTILFTVYVKIFKG